MTNELSKAGTEIIPEVGKYYYISEGTHAIKVLCVAVGNSIFVADTDHWMCQRPYHFDHIIASIPHNPKEPFLKRLVGMFFITK